MAGPGQSRPRFGTEELSATVFAKPDPGWVRHASTAGIFALLVLGIHAGSDRLASYVLAIFGLLDPVGLESLPALARWAALFLELSVDVLLAVPVLTPDFRRTSFRSWWAAVKAAAKKPSLVRIAGPIAVGSAATAGVLAMAREIQTSGHELGYLASGSAATANWLASLSGLFALVLAVWLLALPAVARATAWSARIESLGQLGAVTARTRKLRGTWTAILAAPIAAIAVVAMLDAPSVVEVLRGLLVP